MDEKESQTEDETDETDDIDEEESGKEQDNGNEGDDGIDSDNDGSNNVGSNNEGSNDDGSNDGSPIIDDDDGHQGAQNTSGYVFPFTFALFEGHLLSFRPRRPLLLSGRCFFLFFYTYLIMRFYFYFDVIPPFEVLSFLFSALFPSFTTTPASPFEENCLVAAPLPPPRYPSFRGIFLVFSTQSLVYDDACLPFRGKMSGYGSIASTTMPAPPFEGYFLDYATHTNNHHHVYPCFRGVFFWHTHPYLLRRYRLPLILRVFLGVSALFPSTTTTPAPLFVHAPIPATTTTRAAHYEGFFSVYARIPTTTTTPAPHFEGFFLVYTRKPTTTTAPAPHFERYLSFRAIFMDYGSPCTCAAFFFRLQHSFLSVTTTPAPHLVFRQPFLGFFNFWIMFHPLEVFFYDGACPSFFFF